MNESDTTAYGESLFAATRVAAPERPRLTFDLDVDVCVIGAGLAGLTTAREIARRGWSVAVLEARARSPGARPGAIPASCCRASAQTPQAMLDRVGRERAKRLWALSQAGLDYVRDTILETNMPGIERGTGWLAVSKIDAARASAPPKRGCSARSSVRRSRCGRLRGCASSLKTERYFQAIHFRDAFHIHSLNYALGLAAAAEEAGARIFENTPACRSTRPACASASRRRAGGCARRISCWPATSISASSIPELARTLLPVTTYVVATERLGERLAEAIALSRRGQRRPVGRQPLSRRVRRPPDLVRPHDDVAGQARGISSVRSRAISREPSRNSARSTIDHAWSGTLGNAVHRMPQIGELSPGLWLASGFGGHGLNTTAMAGNLVARAIVEGSQTWRMFAPYELIWAGGSLGRASAQIDAIGPTG